MKKNGLLFLASLFLSFSLFAMKRSPNDCQQTIFDAFLPGDESLKPLLFDETQQQIQKPCPSLIQASINSLLTDFPRHFDGPKVKNLPEELKFRVAQAILEKFPYLLFPITQTDCSTVQREKGIQSVHYSKDLTKLLIATTEGNVILVDKEVPTIWQASNTPLFCAKFNHDETKVVTIAENQGDKPFAVSIWDIVQRRHLLTIDDDTEHNIRTAIFKSQGSKLVIHTAHAITIWDASTQTKQTTFNLFEARFVGADMSHDETQLVTSSNDKTLSVWDLPSGVCRWTSNINHMCHSVKFSQDGKKIFAHDCELPGPRIWDAQKGTCVFAAPEKMPGIKKLNNEGNTYITYFTEDDLLSTDDAEIGDDAIKLWDSETGNCLKILSGHSHYVSHAKFDSKNRWVASASNDKTARIWDAKTGQCLVILEGHKNKLYNAKFSAEDNQVVTTAADRSARFWNVSYLKKPITNLPQVLLLALLYTKYHPQKTTYLDRLNKKISPEEFHTILHSFPQVIQSDLIRRYKIAEAEKHQASKRKKLFD